MARVAGRLDAAVQLVRRLDKPWEHVVIDIELPSALPASALSRGSYLHGVSTRKVDDLVRALGADSGISKSEVSRICADVRGAGAGLNDASCRCRASARPTPRGPARWSGSGYRCDRTVLSRLPNSAAQASRILAVAQGRG